MPYNPKLTGERMNKVNEASPVERVVMRTKEEICDMTIREIAEWGADADETLYAVCAELESVDYTGRCENGIIALKTKINQMERALLWALYNHQGSSSKVGIPIRKVLGIGTYDHLTIEQVAKARSAAIDA